MTQKNWKKVKQIFHDAIGQDSDFRAQFIEKACGDNDNLRREVETLLSSDEKALSFLETPAIVNFPQLKSPKRRVLSDGQHIKNYQIIEQIGAGGMGEVYLAKDTTLDRLIALKVLPENFTTDKDRLKRFVQEARSVSALNHPNILTIYELGQNEDGLYFIASEYVEGQLLSEFCANEDVDISKKLDVAIQLASALAASHEANIIHRDIKPENVIVRPDGYIKVLDFGLAKLIEAYKPIGEDSENSTRLLVETHPRMVMGTVPYMSPEQARGIKTDQRTDIWSLGVVLYELLTGQLPFSGETPTDTIVSIIHEEPKPIDDFIKGLPSQLQALVSRTLFKNPDSRYQTAKELRADLINVKELIDSGPQVIGKAKGLFDTSEFEQNPTLLKEANTQGAIHGPTITAEYIVSQIRSHMIGSLFILAIVLSGLAGFIYWQANQPIYKTSPDAERSYEKGMAAFYNGSYLVAKNNFEKAIQNDGNYVMAHAGLAETYAELGYIEDARLTRELANEINQGNKLPLSSRDLLRFQAINKTILQDFRSALALYIQLAENASTNEKPFAYLDLARCYERNDNLQKAVESYQLALDHDSALASASLRLGVLYGRQQDFENSEQYFTLAESLYKDQKNSEGEIEVVYQRSLLLATKEDASKAREETEKALAKAKIDEIPYQQIKCNLLMSRILRSSGNREEALPYVKDAIRLSKVNGINGLHAESVLELGTVYLFLLDIPKAGEAYESALRLARENKVTVVEKRVLLQLGAFYLYQHKADEALNYIEQVRDFFEKAGFKKEMLDLLYIKAQATASKGDYDLALEIHKELLRKAEGVGDDVQTARAKKGIGTMLSYQDDLDKALPPLYESYAIYNSISQTFEAAYSLLAFGEIQRQLGRLDEAKATLVKAEGLALISKQLLPRTMLFKARILLSERNFEDSIETANAIIASDKTGESSSTLEAKAISALAQKYLGKMAKAKRLIADVIESEHKEPDSLIEGQIYLAHAEILADDDPQQALQSARKAQLAFHGNKPSLEWRAWIFISIAQRNLGEIAKSKESAATADVIFSTLSQMWAPKDLSTYTDRSDIKYYKKMLQETHS